MAGTEANLTIEQGCHETPSPMPGTVAPHVEMTCLQGLADLERLEGPWLDCMDAGEPENAATVMRLMLAHMVVLNKRVMSAMVLDRL